MKTENASLYRAEKLDDLLVFKAHYKQFQFSRHAHEDFALGLMEEGTQKFRCRGVDFCAPVGSLITVNAGEIHDGMSADGSEYRYRIIYIPHDLLHKIGDDMVSPGMSHGFHLPVTIDAELGLLLRTIFCMLECENNDLLEIQTAFYSLLAILLQRHGVSKGGLPAVRSVPDAVLRACTFINDMALQTISLDDIAAAAGLSRYHFLRVFSSSQGMTPYSFLTQRRLQIARESIRKGASIADAALDTCFSDQSHFSRKFKSTYGITPRQYQKAVS